MHTAKQVRELTPQVNGVNRIKVRYSDELRVWYWWADIGDFKNVCVFTVSTWELKKWSENEVKNRLREAMVKAVQNVG